jgi:hypothetical protein
MNMDEINRVARVMVDAEPSADLEVRIRARLDAAPVVAPRRVTWHIAAGLAVAAAVTFAVLGSRGPEVLRSRGPEVQELASPKPEAKAGPESRVPSPAIVASNISSSRTLPSPRHSTGGRRAQVQPTRALSAEELAWMERRIPALDPVTALQVDRLSTESIQPDALAITPMVISALPTTSAEAERIINR